MELVRVQIGLGGEESNVCLLGIDGRGNNLYSVLTVLYLHRPFMGVGLNVNFSDLTEIPVFGILTFLLHLSP